MGGARRARAAARGASPRASPRCARPKHEHVPLRESLRTVARDSWLLSANVALIVLAIAGTTMQTLGSLHLVERGALRERRRRGLHGRRDRGLADDAHDRAHRRPARPAQDSSGSARCCSRPASAPWRCRSARPRSSAAMIACGIAQSIGFIVGLPAGGRRRRARGRRAGRRDGAALGQLGRRRADRPGRHRRGGRSSRATPTAFALAGALALAAALGVRWRTRG